MDNIRNDTLWDTIMQETSPLEDLITINKKRNLKSYGHVIKANNHSTAILQDITLGKKKQTEEKLG